jgi:4-carboxymuconolactone decarboxylase
MTEQTSPETNASKEPSGVARQFGYFAPALVHFTDDVLFGEVWTRPELSPRDRSLVTVTALAAAGNSEQLTFHLGLARNNGLTETELTEAITHLAFYAGWPRAMSAMTVAKQILGDTHDEKKIRRPLQ